MIDLIRIENLGVIAQAELDLGSGLTTLTGETGAGKTMAITSLRLLLGAKADARKVRHGADMARVEGSFVVPADSPVLERVRDAGGDYEEEGDQAVVLVARHVPASGRSRSFLGGRSVPTATLSEIASQLVTVHGQMDQMRLAAPAQQRKALDAFGGQAIAELSEAYREAYESRKQAAEALESFEARSREAARERLALEALVSKIDEVAPEEGEEDRLKAESSRLENAEEHYRAFDGASVCIQGSDSMDTHALAAVGAAIAALEPVGDAAQDVRERLEAVESELEDIGQSLASLARDSEGDPERLSEIYTRRHALAGLRKELGMGLDEALAEAEEARAMLAELGDPEATRARLESELAAAENDMLARGAELSEARTEAAQDFAALVQGELGALALADARFEISVVPAEPAPSGMDNVTFLLASHREAPLGPLGSVASGGELSRIMLAIEVSLATRESKHAHTFLFDEVDAGVGGKAALAVGKRLAKLAESSQVIVVTHLAQVAACAASQLRVVKEGGGEEATRTRVEKVEGADREAELARMLSGTDSATARAHAAELLASATVA